MEIGVLTVPWSDRPLEDVVQYLANLDVDTVELGCGGHPGDAHLSAETVLDDERRQTELLELLDSHGLRISALATHNNPLHPDQNRADAADAELRRAIELGEQLDVDAVTCFSGLPAGSVDDSTPNWITAPWPPEHKDALEYQWDVAIEYWSDIAEVAESKSVAMAIEMHPNMLVYEPSGLVRLREETGHAIGANFDPSHLYWQGIDIQEAIRYLASADAIMHVHAKDTGIYGSNARVKGVLDTTSYDRVADRSWLFRTIGYGHGIDHWKDIVSTLRMVDYEGTLSIEHEDALMSNEEGIEKAVAVLDDVVLRTTIDEITWAE